MVQNMIKFEENQENDEHIFPFFPEYLPKCQIFGLIDLLKEMIFALSLIIFEYYPILNITVFLAIEILYINLLMKYKPTDNNKIFLFSESANILILLICLIGLLMIM